MGRTSQRKAERGDFVVATDNHQEGRDVVIEEGREYVVSDVLTAHGTTYYRILCDDDRGRDLWHGMFRPATPSDHGSGK